MDPAWLTALVALVVAVFGGLAVGAPVRLAGIKVGDIEEMKVYYDETLKKTRKKILLER